LSFWKLELAVFLFSPNMKSLAIAAKSAMGVDVFAIMPDLRLCGFDH
jgi:hypothetical protein